jgi:hypothetical protein
MGLLRTLIIFATVFVIVRFLSRYVLPLFFSSYIENKMSQMNRNSSSNQSPQQRREGEVTIDTSAGNKKKYSKNTGDYVDFEEIK